MRCTGVTLCSVNANLISRFTVATTRIEFIQDQGTQWIWHYIDTTYSYIRYYIFERDIANRTKEYK